MAIIPVPLVIGPFCRLIDRKALWCDYCACANQKRQIQPRFQSTSHPLIQSRLIVLFPAPGLAWAQAKYEADAEHHSSNGSTALIAVGRLEPIVHVMAPLTQNIQSAWHRYVSVEGHVHANGAGDAQRRPLDANTAKQREIG